ncbi:MAG: hypothetical protein OXP09_07515 [Gammaproteobacteria bacterium]|nr:hypothetical protein [Gammaproteobacteria bacterium]
MARAPEHRVLAVDGKASHDTLGERPVLVLVFGHVFVPRPGRSERVGAQGQ